MPATEPEVAAAGGVPEVLAAREVSWRVSGKAIVDRVDLTLSPGEVHAVTGPNGSGKSTLLRLLVGELEATDGRVVLGATEVRLLPPGQWARRRACLPQHSTLQFPFTIGEVVEMGRHPHRETSEERRRAIRGPLERVGLLDRAREGYLHLSGGEKQRVHLARVLAQLGSPQGTFLLLDEPTSSLDLTFQQLVFAVAREWAEGGGAVAIVLHDLNHVVRHADRATLLDGGRVVASGDPAAVLAPERIGEIYHVEAEWVVSGPHRLLCVHGPSHKNS